MEDTMIIDLYLARDEEASLQTEIKYGPRLRRLSERIVGDPGDAEEAVNDALLSAWNSIPPHEPRDYFFRFLSRIARCASLNILKRKQRTSSRVTALTDELAECLPSAHTPEADFDSAELVRALEAFLREQNEEARRMFVRRYWYADSVADIATLFGCGDSRVKMTLMRTRKKLREYLEARSWTI